MERDSHLLKIYKSSNYCNATKEVDVSDFSDDIKRTEDFINDYPRKILGGISANLATKNHIAPP